MDILRKELEQFYLSQNLSSEKLARAEVDKSLSQAKSLVGANNGCAVITDAASDRCYVFSGDLGPLLGYESASPSYFEAESSDEDVIYERIHPEDLVDKRFLEYEFFRHIDNKNPCEKSRFIAKCSIRMRDREGEYRLIDNTTQALCLSPAGKIWLILCTYTLSVKNVNVNSIEPSILDCATGEILRLSFGNRRKKILSEREKEVLLLIKSGRPSKQIADILGISVNTVNRHRQNILEKLSVGNSIEAITAATVMNIL